MRVALFGGTGYVGRYLVDALLEADHHPILLVRSTSIDKVLRPDDCTLVPGDIEDEAAIRRVLAEADAAIYNIGLLREFPERGITFRAMHFEGAKRVMDLAEEMGVDRFLLMSANGVRADGTPYQQTKYMAEEYLRTTNLRWTVFRPSVLFGDPRGAMEFATQLYRDIVRPPLPAPMFFDGLLPLQAGAFQLSPIHVRDVAQCFVRSLDNTEAIGRSYDLGGPDELSWREILTLIARTTGRHLLPVPAPAWAVKAVAGVLDRFAFFPITRDQITMLMEGNTCDGSEALATFNIEPTPFAQESLDYLNTTSEPVETGPKASAA